LEIACPSGCGQNLVGAIQYKKHLEDKCPKIKVISILRDPPESISFILVKKSKSIQEKIMDGLDEMCKRYAPPQAYSMLLNHGNI